MEQGEVVVHDDRRPSSFVTGFVVTFGVLCALFVWSAVGFLVTVVVMAMIAAQ